MLFKDYSEQKLLGHTGRCFDLRYSYDCSMLLSASEDGTAMLWDFQKKKVHFFVNSYIEYVCYL